jgi:hypothetical protein
MERYRRKLENSPKEGQTQQHRDIYQYLTRNKAGIMISQKSKTDATDNY